MKGRSRIHFFPSGLPDESFYSIVARYHHLSGNPYDRDTLRELFDKHTIVVTSHLPSSIDALVRVLPSGSTIDVQAIINRHTVFPYYRPFLTARQISLSQTAMKGDSAIGLKTMMGLVASQVGGGNLYRFCHRCVTQDDQRYGQPYWHRAHQLPAVFICHEHQIPLFELEADWVALNRHRLFLPTTPVVISCAKIIAIEERHFSSMRDLAIDSKRVLDAGYEAISAVQMKNIYRDLAADLGLMHSSDRVRISDFSAWIQQQVADFPATREFRFIHFGDRLHAPAWALSLLRKARKSTHPLKHLLLLRFLNGNWNSVVTRTHTKGISVPQPSVKSKWPEVPSNTLGQKLKSMLVEDKQSLRQCARLLGQSITTLRIEAAILGIKVSTRPKILNEIKLATLRKALASAQPLQALAQRHQVSEVSLYRILRMHPDITQAREQLIFERERDRRRKIFFLGCQTSFARRLPDYHWLHKHDRQWLTQVINTAPQKNILSVARLDWNKRDLLFSEAVKTCSKQLYAIQKPVRISKASIGRKMRNLPILEKHLTKLPLTSEALSANIESVEDFQCRRLRWAAQQILTQRQSIPSWLLLRIAGLKPPLSGKVLHLSNDLAS